MRGKLCNYHSVRCEFTNFSLFFLGPLAAPIGVEGNAFLATKYADESWPDIQVVFISSHPGFDGGTLYKNFLKINSKVCTVPKVQTVHFSFEDFSSFAIFIFWQILTGDGA